MKRILLALAEGIFWSAVGIVVLGFTLPAGPVDSGILQNNFGSRWEGSCTGWTRSLALLHVAGDLFTWTAYVTIAIVIRRLHPVVRLLRKSWITVLLISCVFISCGATHLFDAYATFNPVYVATGWFKVVTAIIGLVGATLIAHDLVTAFDKVKIEQQRLLELEEKFNALR